MLIDSRIAIKLRRFIIVINDLSQLTSLGVDEKLVNPTISSSSSEVRLLTLQNAGGEAAFFWAAFLKT